MSLDDVLKRFEWAEEQLLGLDTKLGALRRAYRDPPISVERKKGGKVREYSIGNVPKISRDLGLMVGDCLHNFRATINNLAYTIATENNPAGLTSEERRAVSFPIADQRSDFRDARSKGVIAKLPARAQARIQGMQPYKRGKEAQGHPLSVLKKLTDMDKHRTIPVVAWSVTPFAIDPAIPGARLTPLADELVPNTKFLRLDLPAQYADMNVNVVLRFTVAIKGPETGGYRDASLWLGYIRTYIFETVVPRLAIYCPAATPATVARARRLIWRG